MTINNMRNAVAAALLLPLACAAPSNPSTVNLGGNPKATLASVTNNVILDLSDHLHEAGDKVLVHVHEMHSAVSREWNPNDPTYRRQVMIPTHTKVALAARAAQTSLPAYVPGDGGSLTCPANNGSAINIGDVNYKMLCFTDFYDHDLQLNYTQSVEGCARICESTKDCIAGVFVPGQYYDGPCYLKTAAQQPSVENDWAMAFYSAGPASTSSSSAAMSTITTSTTTNSSIVIQVTMVSTPSETVSTTSTSVVIATLDPSSSRSMFRNGTQSTTVSSAKATPTAASNETANRQYYVPCGNLNRKNNLFNLRSHVIFGAPEFENLYVGGLDPNAPSTVPALTSNVSNAGQYYFDPSTISVALYHGDCDFSGLVMVPGHSGLAWSNVLISDEVGTARMSIDWNALVWDNDRFGSWLVCKKEGSTAAGENGTKFELYYWDAVTNKGVDTDRCAKVQLLVENY